MKHLSIFLLASAFLLSFAPGVPAGEKPLLPAFGKELVPDEKTAEHNAAKDAEMDEGRDKRDGGGKRRSGGPHIRGKIHTELDGSEDGGESGGVDDGM